MNLQRYSPIGLDIRPCSVCAAQLVRTARGVRPHRLARFPVEGGLEERAEQVLELLQRRGFVGRKAVIAAPRAAVRSGVVSVPLGAGDSAVDAIARSEIARTHDLDPGSFELACWALPAASGVRQESGGALACVCPHEAITPLIDRFESSGVEIAAVDLESQAIARVCRRVPGAAPQALRVVVDLGRLQSLLIVMLGGTVLYERVIPECALNGLLEDVSGLLGLDRYEGERAVLGRGLSGFAGESGGKAARIRALIEDYSGAIAGELSMSIEYAARRHGLGDSGSAMLIGPGAVIPGIGERLSESCELDVQVVRPRSVLEDHGAFDGIDDPAMVVALGLAERFD